MRQQTELRGRRFLWSGCFQIAGSKLATLGYHIEAEALTFGQRIHASLLHCGYMYENVFVSIIRLNKSKSLGAIEKLNSADCHSELLMKFRTQFGRGNEQPSRSGAPTWRAREPDVDERQAKTQIVHDSALFPIQMQTHASKSRRACPRPSSLMQNDGWRWVTVLPPTPVRSDRGAGEVPGHAPAAGASASNGFGRSLLPQFSGPRPV